MEIYVVKSGDKPFILNVNHPWIKQCTHFQLNREFFKFARARGLLQLDFSSQQWSRTTRVASLEPPQRVSPAAPKWVA